MTRTRVLLAGLTLSGALGGLTGCSDADDGGSTPGAGSASAAPSATPSAAPSVGASTAPSSAPPPSPAASAGAGGGASPLPSSAPADPAPAPSAGAPAPFPADTAVDEAASTGGPLSVRAVRVAPQQGYDRIVFELAGRQAGEPGWRVEYVDDPSSQGSGDPVDVRGRAVLAVTIRGSGYPMDTGVEEVSDDPALPSGLGVVQDVVLGAVFEGDYEAFVGLSEQAPFRVFRLRDPARVVLDVRTR